MIYLFLNIIFSSSFILIFRWVQDRDEELKTVGAISYIASALLAALLFLFSDKTFSINTALLGAINGIMYFIGYLLLIPVLFWKGAALTAVASRLAMLMPVVFGILFWDERPSLWQTLGIGFGAFSLLLIGKNKTRIVNSIIPSRIIILMMIFFIVAGSARTSQEAFKYYGNPDEIAFFVLVAFSIASLASIAIIHFYKLRSSLSEVIIGAVVGFSNCLQTVFLLKALEQFPGFIVFPIISAGGLVFTTSIAIFLFKEPLSKSSTWGIAIAILAMALLNINH